MSIRSIAALASALTLLACTPPLPAPKASPSPSASPPHEAPVVLTYLGVAGWQVADGAHTLLIDPYFSRVDVKDPSAPLPPDTALIARYAPDHADAILVEHSHYDHLLDVPTIANHTNAPVIGTESTLNVARAAGVPPSHLLLANGGETFEIGPFSIRTIRGLHSLTGQPSALIPRDITLPMPASAYAEGGTLDYLVRVEQRTVLFVGSANFIESELTGLRPDVAVLATGLREKIPDYSCRLMRALGRPRLVLTDHFDAHWKPLGPEQMSLGDDARASLARFADEIHACAPETRVVIPTHLQPISI
jgi:L-ascorbate metabolism protein UlaG (beta-lactamase superfamily)